MTWYEAIILGIVEGITEFLPISSTGHLIIAADLMGMSDDEETKAAIDGYIIVIQAFALLAIIGLYFPRMIQMLRGLFGRDRKGLKLFINICIAFAPILVLGPLLHSTIMTHLFRPTPVLLALFLGGIWMIWIDHRRKQFGEEQYILEIDDLTWKHALGIGLFQCASMWPGTSRAMMTIAGATVLGMKPARAAEFSFLLGLPTILGATVYELGKDLLLSQDPDTAAMFDVIGWGPLLLGCVVTVISAALAVKWLVGFLSNHGLAAFGWYRIALCVVMGVLLLFNVIQLA
ncbi:MAG: undecaprenyl-diphosphate phosphatase [Phycisphaerales bacterium]|nr:MAG: undecaprenyl-diphosphate phosphatase [Phycisphaerales bacterium]